MDKAIENKRNGRIDLLRAIAIVIMFYAHALPHLGFNSYSAFDRIISSLAAPIFLFLVGYNLFPINTKERRIKNALRACIVLAMAAFIDIFTWNITPFFSFDVLYTIGFSILFMVLIGKLKFQLLVLCCITIVLIQMFYLWNGSYIFDINEPKFLEWNENISVLQPLRNMFFDGWFPLFPWLVFPLLGFIAKMKNVKFNHGYLQIIALTVFLFFLWQYNSNTSYLREFAVEVFYPVDLIYLLGSMAFIALMFYVVSLFNPNNSNILSKLGRISFFMYFFHLEFYHLFFDDLLNELNGNFYLAFLICILIFLCITLGISWLKQSKVYNENNLFVSVLFGKK